MSAIFRSFFIGLEDYTINERGDVGSWIRLACLKGFASICEMFIRKTFDPRAKLEEFGNYLPTETYHNIVGCMLKQGVERLDNVRQCVGELFMSLLELPAPAVPEGDQFVIKRKDTLLDMFKNSQGVGWNDGAWLYPRAVRFLDIPEYQLPVLKGLVLSIGSRTTSTVSMKIQPERIFLTISHIAYCQREPASSALLSYAQNLDISPQNDSMSHPRVYTLYALLTDLLIIAEEKSTSNIVVIPVLQSLIVLLESGLLSSLSEVDYDEYQILYASFSYRRYTYTQRKNRFSRILTLATKNIERMKNVQRIEESMRV